MITGNRVDKNSDLIDGLAVIGFLNTTLTPYNEAIEAIIGDTVISPLYKNNVTTENSILNKRFFESELFCKKDMVLLKKLTVDVNNKLKTECVQDV